MTDTFDQPYWDVVVVMLEAQLDADDKLFTEFSDNNSIETLLRAGGTRGDSLAAMINYGDLAQKMTDHGIKVEWFPEDASDAYRILLKRYYTEQTQKALNIVKQVIQHCSHMEVNEIKDKIKYQLDNAGICINKEDLTAIAQIGYTRWKAKDDSLSALRATMSRASGKSVSEIAEDLKVQRARYGLPDMSDEDIEQKAKELHWARNHLVLAAGKAFAQLASSVGDVIKLLHDLKKDN